MPEVIKSVIVWLHIPLGRDTTNSCHEMVLMNLSYHWPVILRNGERSREMKLIVCQKVVNDLITSVL